MNHLRLEDVRSYWAEDAARGALLDIYVVDTGPDDWRVAVDVIRQTGWRRSYSEDGEERSMPTDVADVLARAPRVLWRIWPSERVSINCHFLEGDMEFDASPREIEDQTGFDALCDFITVLGRAVGKSVLVGVEGGQPRIRPGLQYDPAVDAVVKP